MVNIRIILESLTGKELSSKFNTRWGHKNVRISEEDQYKAAFKTTFETYIPRVMYFGLMNAPPHFQRVLRHDFAQVLWEHPNEIFDYMDNFIVATEKSPKGVKWHQEIYHKILHVMKERSYFLKLSKCQFERPKMDILGWPVEDENIKIDPTKATGIDEWPKELKNDKEVQSTLGVSGHRRPSIRGFAHIAKPLTELTRETTPFKCTQECRGALDKLIKIVTSEPILACQNWDKPFELEEDASAYTVGAILFQEDENERRRDVGYFPKALNPAERNYNIWDREFLAAVTGLHFWRCLLGGSLHKVTVWTNHANVQYYCHPQKVNRRVTRYITLLGDYKLELEHLPGIKNHADGLSRRPDYDQRGEDNDEITALLKALFARVISDVAFNEQIHKQQKEHSERIEEWKNKYHPKYSEGNWWKDMALVVTGRKHVWRTIAKLYHDTPTTGHQGVFKTIGMAKGSYWWPTMWEYLKKYMQGSGICQQDKSNTHPNKPPLQSIVPETNVQPFQTIAMDFIVKLPLSRGYNVCSDTSLSQFIALGINVQDPQIVIIDFGKSGNYIEATVLLPYGAIIKVPEIATFKQHTLSLERIPNKAIIGKNTCLAPSFFRELCEQLKMKQVMMLAHRQIGKWVEETNQSVETAPRIFNKFRQNNWSEWLPLIQYQNNGILPSITEETPHESWMGFAPHARKTEKSDPLSGTRKQMENPQITRFQAQKAMRRARGLHSKQTKWTPYVKGQKVWSEGMHLSTSHPFVELCPK